MAVYASCNRYRINLLTYAKLFLCEVINLFVKYDTLIYSVSITACICSHYANLLLRCTIDILLKFIVLYFNNFILLRPKNLYVILGRHHELPEDDNLNVETRRSILFVINLFDIIVQSLVKL